MGRRSTATARAGLLSFAAWMLLAGPLPAEDLLEFKPPREATARLQDGGTTRGQLKSISASQIVIVLRDNTEREIALPKVRSVSANDKSFTYSPAQEDFSKLLERAQKIQGLFITRDAGTGTAATDDSGAGAGAPRGGAPNRIPNVYATAIGLAPEETPAPVNGTSGFDAQRGFAGVSLRAQPPAPLDTAAVASLQGASGSVPSTTSVKTTPPAVPLVIARPGEKIYCSNPDCGKEVPSAKYGEKCPHCGIIWAAESSTDVIARTTPGNTGGPAASGNPFGAAPNQENTAAAVTTAASTPGGSEVTTSSGFSIDSVPWWGKIAGFAGLMFVLWFVAQRR